MKYAGDALKVPFYEMLKCQTQSFRLLSLDVSNSQAPMILSQEDHKRNMVENPILECSRCALEFLESSVLELEHKRRTIASQKARQSSSSLDHISDSTAEELTNCLCKSTTARPCWSVLRLHERSLPNEVLPN